MPEVKTKTWWIYDVTFTEGWWTAKVAHSSATEPRGVGYCRNMRHRSLARLVEDVALYALEMATNSITFDNERSCMRTIAEGT